MKKTLLFISLLITTFSFSQTQIGLDIDGEAAHDVSGRSISLSSDGSIVAIGASNNNGNGFETGHVRVYENIGGIWTQIGSDIDGENDVDESGTSVSLSSGGSIIAIGAPYNDGNGEWSGHVRVYENIGDVWTQIGSDIDGEAVDDQSGSSVSLSSDGSIVAIGSSRNQGNGTNSGHVRVYENIGGIWTQIGSDIDGEATGNQSGTSISLSSNGSIVAIGAPINNGNGTESGHVRVYKNIGGVWTQIGADIDGETANNRFGQSVSLSSDGSTVAIGAPYNDGNGTDSGHVRVYKNIGGVWTQIGADIDGDRRNESGSSVSLSNDGSIVAIGAIRDDGNGNSAGHVRVYKNIVSVWTQIGSDIDGEVANDLSGNSVSLSSDGSIVAIGALRNDENGNSAGHVRVYDLSGVLSTDRFILEKTSMYPNPTNKEFIVRMSDNVQFKKLRVYSALGKYILESDKKEVNIESLSIGLYFVEITTYQGKTTKKLLIN